MGNEEERKGWKDGKGHGWWQKGGLDGGGGGEGKKNKATGMHAVVGKQEPAEEKGGAPDTAIVGDSRKVVVRVQRNSNRKVGPGSSLHTKWTSLKKEKTAPTEACAEDVRDKILKCKGFVDVKPDLRSSQVTVKTVLEPAKLVDSVHKTTGRDVVLWEQEPVEK